MCCVYGQGCERGYLDEVGQDHVPRRFDFVVGGRGRGRGLGERGWRVNTHTVYTQTTQPHIGSSLFSVSYFLRFLIRKRGDDSTDEPFPCVQIQYGNDCPQLDHW